MGGRVLKIGTSKSSFLLKEVSFLRKSKVCWCESLRSQYKFFGGQKLMFLKFLGWISMNRRMS